MHTKFWSENVKRIDHSEDLDVDGDIIRMDLTEIGWEGVKWIHLAQDRDVWQAVVSTAVNLRLPQKAGNFLTS
jgi:hypothetical protein